MRRWLGAAVTAVALASAAGCSNDTGIIVEVMWEPTQVPAGADRLRLYVGTQGANSSLWIVNDGGTVKPYDEITEPYRYLLRPDGDLDAIGDLQFAAALTHGLPPDAIEPLAFGAYPEAVRFVDGQLGVVPIVLTQQPFVPAGDAGECVIAGELVIGRPDDADCDGTLDDVDCAPFDSGDRSMAQGVDGDGVDCGDCLDGPVDVPLGGWSIDPGTVFPGQDELAFRVGNGIPDNVACLHIDFDCSGKCGDEAPDSGAPRPAPDDDGSGSNACGGVRLRQDAHTCAPHPSDCDEADPGHTVTTGDPEVCDGRDSNCDGRPVPPIPCAIDRGGPLGCNIGVRTCDDDTGHLDADPTACVDAGFPHLFSAECVGLHETEQCLFDPDPLKCGALDRRACKVGVTDGGACGNLEKVRLPGVIGTGCDWRVVGGTMQGDWDVGFGDGTAGALAPQTDACAPFLLVRPANADPQKRTVMLVGDSRVAASPIVAFFLTLEPDAACDGLVDCSPPLAQQ